MKKIYLSNGWQFRQKGQGEWQEVSLPHDALIGLPVTPKGERYTAFFPRGCFEYRRRFRLTEAQREGAVYLVFDGVMTNAYVSLNGSRAAFHPNGYTPFYVDVNRWTDGLDVEITVRADNQMDSSRWYTGAGIYREVWVQYGSKAHIKPWSLRADTLKIRENGCLVEFRAQAEGLVQNNDYSVHFAVWEGETQLWQGKSVREGDTFRLLSELHDITLWSPNNPKRYRVTCSLLQNGVLTDEEETTTGFRHLRWSASEGLRINGIETKLVGGCLHHDNGPLGAVSSESIEERKLSILRDSGFNAVRCAHNPPSTAFLNVCDRLGILVIDEFADAWVEPKRPQDYHMFFEDWWQRDVTAMVSRDSIHPSVIMWSTGNEVSEIAGTSEGAAISASLSALFHRLDPTRPVTNGMILLPDLDGSETEDERQKHLQAFYPVPAAINADLHEMDNMLKNTFRPTFSHTRDIYGERTKAFAETLDVCGYNYMSDRYAFDAEKFPERIIVGSETFPTRLHEYWRKLPDMPHVLGDFLWTAFDFLGEAGVGYCYHDRNWNANPPFPARTCGTGAFDICGFDKPFNHYRRIVTQAARRPYIVVRDPRYQSSRLGLGLWSWEDDRPCWTYPGHEGQLVSVTVYADCEAVELVLNGCRVGREAANEQTAFRASFCIPYEPGTLEARAIMTDGSIETVCLETTGVLCGFRLTPYRKQIAVGEYGFVTIEAIDAENRLVIDDDTLIKCEVRHASLAALGTGRTVTSDNYTSSEIRLYEGRALLVVRAEKPGKINVCINQKVQTTIDVVCSERKEYL